MNIIISKIIIFDLILIIIYFVQGFKKPRENRQEGK